MLNAQKSSNTGNGDFDALAEQSEYLDQLVNNWYVKRSLSDNENFTGNENNVNNTEIPDSLYIERLLKMPTIVPMSYNGIVKKWIQFYTKNTSTRRYMLGMR